MSDGSGQHGRLPAKQAGGTGRGDGGQPGELPAKPEPGLEFSAEHTAGHAAAGLQSGPGQQQPDGGGVQLGAALPALRHLPQVQGPHQAAPYTVNTVHFMHCTTKLNANASERPHVSSSQV